MEPTKKMFEQFSPESYLPPWLVTLGQDSAETMESGPIASIQSDASKRLDAIRAEARSRSPVQDQYPVMSKRDAAVKEAQRVDKKRGVVGPVQDQYPVMSSKSSTLKVGTPVKGASGTAQGKGPTPPPPMSAMSEMTNDEYFGSMIDDTGGISDEVYGMADTFGSPRDEFGELVGEIKSAAPRRVSGVLPHVEPELAGVVGRSSGSSASTQAVAKAVAEGKYKNIKMAALGSALAFGGVYTANRDKRKRYR